MAVEFGIQRFAVVFQKIQAVFVGERPDGGQVGRVAENGNGDDGPGLGRQGVLQGAGVDVEGLKLYINEAELEPVLLQRVVGSGPGNRRHDDLVTALQRLLFLMEQGGDGDQVGR